MLLAELAAVWAAVAQTPARRAKISAIADLLGRAEPDEVSVAVAFLSGDLLQRQIGVGYAALTGLLRSGAAADHAGPDTAAPAEASAPTEPGLTLAETDAAFAAIGEVTGPGSAAQRRKLLDRLWRRATGAEREFLVRLLAGDLRQGALGGVMTEAVAQAAGVPAVEVRRAHQLGGFLPEVARAALGGGPGSPGSGADGAGGPGGPGDPRRALAALRAVTLHVGRPVRPMLASPAASVEVALERISPAALEWKIDGIRIQVHRSGREVAVFTRTLDDITGRLPEIVDLALALDESEFVIDAEAVALRPDGRPHPFQITAARTASQAGGAGKRVSAPVNAFCFDLLYVGGIDLIDAPGSERHRLLSELVPPDLLIPRLVTADPAVAGEFFRDATARGHEGVVVKSLDAPYRAGRRGADWLKVKPRHTLDLVILAAEWGHGRRRGWLSNLHLGARDPVSGGLVMLGKTFKGLTDQMLEWQTDVLLDLADPPQPPRTGQEHGVVRMRPELVAEIAFDGVQASRRYPGGLALRFARVLRYREDKTAAEADTIDTVRELWPADAPPDEG